jgi:hypothetical protein
MTRLIVCLSTTALTLAVSAWPVSAQQVWLRLGDFGHPAYLDTTAVVRRSAIVTQVRVRLVDYGGPGYDRLEIQEVNCQAHEARFLKVEVRAVDARATLDDPGPQQADTAWHGYVGGGFGARLLGAICGYLRSTAPGP